MDFKNKYIKYKMKYLNLKELQAKFKLGDESGEVVPYNPKQVSIKDYETKDLIFQIIRHEIQLKRTKKPELNIVIEQLEEELNERLMKLSDFVELKKYLIEIGKIIDKLKQLTIDTSRVEVTDIINKNETLKQIREPIITTQPVSSMQLRPRPSPSQPNPNCKGKECVILNKYIT